MTKRTAIVTILIGLGLFTCRSAPLQAPPPIPSLAWCELLADAYALGVRDECGEGWIVTREWAPFEQFTVASSPRQLLVRVREKGAGGPDVLFAIVPWGEYAYRLAPGDRELMDIVCVAPEVIVLRPVPSATVRNGGAECVLGVMTEVSGSARYRAVVQEALSAPLPAGVRVVQAREYPFHIELSLGPGKIPEDRILRSLVPGKLLVLALLPDTGPMRVRILPPLKPLADWGGQDEAARRIVGDALTEARKTAVGDERARRTVFFAGQKKLRALFPSPSPEHEMRFTLARDRLLDFLRLPEWIIGEEETLAVFPDYEPKRTPDTLIDYRPGLSALVLAMPEARLENLDALLGLLKEYRQKAKKNPGEDRRGRIQLGEDPLQYVPSDEELLESEIGERIALISASAPQDKIYDYLKAHRLALTKIEYGRISFRHADVMGSGRFFYASRPETVTVRLGN